MLKSTAMLRKKVGISCRNLDAEKLLRSTMNSPIKNNTFSKNVYIPNVSKGHIWVMTLVRLLIGDVPVPDLIIREIPVPIKKIQIRSMI